MRAFDIVIPNKKKIFSFRRWIRQSISLLIMQRGTNKCKHIYALWCKTNQNKRVKLCRCTQHNILTISMDFLSIFDGTTLTTELSILKRWEMFKARLGSAVSATHALRHMGNKSEPPMHTNAMLITHMTNESVWHGCEIYSLWFESLS